MPETAWLVPSVFQNLGYEGGNNWGGNVSNVQTSDNNSIWVGSAGKSVTQSAHARMTGFDFSVIPDGWVIKGIEVQKECRSGNAAAGASDHTVILVNGSANSTADHIGLNKAHASWPNNADVIHWYGGVADTWGAPLTTTLVKSSNFGVTFRANVSSPTNNNVDHWIDHVQMRVTYGPPPIYKGAIGSSIYQGAQTVDQLYRGANSLFG